MYQFYQKHFLFSKRFVTNAKSSKKRLLSSRLVTCFLAGCFLRIESHLQNLAVEAIQTATAMVMIHQVSEDVPFLCRASDMGFMNKLDTTTDDKKS